MSTPVIRIPNLPIGQIVDEHGNATDDELTFRHALITSLQQNFGNEGVVTPSQSPDNIETIRTNINENGQYTCALGTTLYSQHPTDYTQDKVVMAVRNGNDYPMSAPVFKTVTLT